MNYQSVADTAKLWSVSERTVRNYCATGKILGAVLIGKTWNIPQDAERPERINKKQQAPRTLLTILQDEMAGHVKGGIYHKIQIDLTYNSNHIEGSRLLKGMKAEDAIARMEGTTCGPRPKSSFQIYIFSGLL